MIDLIKNFRKELEKEQIVNNTKIISDRKELRNYIQAGKLFFGIESDEVVIDLINVITKYETMPNYEKLKQIDLLLENYKTIGGNYYVRNKKNK